MIWIFPFHALSKINAKDFSSARWIYLGKDVTQRRRVQKLLGIASQYQLAGRLHIVAENLRKPFLNFVGEFGSQQKNERTWWASLFAWKSWVISDLFLLVCYLKLIAGFIQETKKEQNLLLVVIEDPWLFLQAKKIWGGWSGVIFQGRCWLLPEKIFLIFLGLIKRPLWIVKMVRNYLRQRLAWGFRPLLPPSGLLAGIYSYPLPRCLKSKQGWEDPFLPKMDQWLKEFGYNILRFSPPEVKGFEKELAQRQAYFHPLILYANVQTIFRSVMTFWRPRFKTPLQIDSLVIKQLVSREWWKEIGRSTLCLYRFFYECLDGLLKKGNWKWLVFPYENQPWEKMLLLSAQKHGVRTAGIQHAVFSKFSLAYFFGETEALRAPKPDILFASGPHMVSLLEEGGIPKERIILSGSVRYGYPMPDLPSAPLQNILVALSVDRSMNEHLLATICQAFPDGGAQRGLAFYIKPHPMCPVREKEIGFPATFAPTDFRVALEACGLVLFVGSTVGPEITMMGRRALRYQPELLLNVDPSESFGDQISTFRDDNLREVLLNEIQEQPKGVKSKALEECARGLFAPVNPGLFQSVFRL